MTTSSTADATRTFLTVEDMTAIAAEINKIII